MGSYCCASPKYSFRPHLVPTLALLILVPLFLRLGFWQLDRAAYKRALATTMAERAEQPAVQIEGTPEAGASLEFRKVRVRGRFEPDQQVFIENRKYQGQNGFHVITPLRIEGSEMRVLVDRGWVPMSKERSALPMVKTPTSTVTVTGEVDIPHPPALALAPGDPPARGPMRWPYLTVERFAALTAYPLQPFVILQSPEDGTGFLRRWSRPQPSDGLHIGYAIQWFAFALIVLVIYLRLSLSREQEDNPEGSK